jgi:AbrB family looped-hinge helix DNA binding protein
MSVNVGETLVDMRGSVGAMKASIDAAGRIVVPSAIRRELGLHGPVEVDIVASEGRIVIEPTTVPTKVVKRGKRLWVLEPQQPVPILTSDETRQALEKARSWPR